MTKEELFLLIDGCRERGVVHLKFDNVEFTIAPKLAELEGDVSKPLDKTKCLQCQAAPPNGRFAGLCRNCSLGNAGVAS